MNKKLESTTYRCIFEYVKKEGVTPLIKLIEDIKNVKSRERLIYNALFLGNHDLLSLIKKSNKSTINYLREHRKEFDTFSLLNSDVLTILRKLEEDETLLNLYLGNAKKLEELKISHIEIVNFNKLFGFCDYLNYVCDIYRNKEGKIIEIIKLYTDGIIEVLSEEYIVNKTFRHGYINFKVKNAKNEAEGIIRPVSFLLRVENSSLGKSYREIKMAGFDFDQTYLPTDEEMGKYEIPKILIKK